MTVFTEPELIQIRRHLHENPELSLQEKETKNYLLSVINGLNQTNLSIKTLSEVPTAILVRISGSKPKRTIGYRTDMDALPVIEQTGLPYASKNEGIMHACGHDIHMTVALGLLSYYSENQPKDNLIFFFQPAEESENGGKLAYENGAFEGIWKPDEIYALHVTPDLKAGTIGCRMGTLFAGTTEVNIDLKGKGGHAAYPQKANDMIVAASQLIGQIQTIISRSIDPVEGGVITIGKMEAGTIRNVIAGHAHLEGTIRGLTQKMILLIGQRLRDVCAGVAKSFNADVIVELNQGGYLPVENDPHLTREFIKYLKSDPQVNFVETEPAMTGEDFGYLLSKIPGTMCWLGVEDDTELHSAYFSPQESAIMSGVTAFQKFFDERMKQ